MSYQAVLEELARRPTVRPGSPEEKVAIERFTDFVSVLSAENIRTKARRVYAENAYFNDTLKELRGAEAIEEYMAGSMGATESVTVEVTEVAAASGNYYFRSTALSKFHQISGNRRGYTFRVLLRS